MKHYAVTKVKEKKEAVATYGLNVRLTQDELDLLEDVVRRLGEKRQTVIHRALDIGLVALLDSYNPEVDNV